MVTAVDHQANAPEMQVEECPLKPNRRHRYRPLSETINPKLYCVEVMAHGPARLFVERHHYTGSWPAVRLAVGLYRGRDKKGRGLDLQGVAAFGVPAQAKVLSTLCAGHAAVELSRVVLHDAVPVNGESWFLSRALKIARRHLGVTAVVSYSDPQPRTALDGRVVTPGHLGVVYQALGAEYLGCGSPRTLYLDKEGRPLAPRTMSKILSGRKEAEGAERHLVMRGAPEREVGESPQAWLSRIRRIFRRERNPGCHRYLWRWDNRGMRIALPLPSSYPR